MCKYFVKSVLKYVAKVCGRLHIILARMIMIMVTDFERIMIMMIIVVMQVFLVVMVMMIGVMDMHMK